MIDEIEQCVVIEEFCMGSITFNQLPSKIMLFDPMPCVEDTARIATFASTQIGSPLTPIPIHA